MEGFIRRARSYALMRYSSWNRQRLCRRMAREGIERLHIGCGDILVQNSWLNMTYDPRDDYGVIQKRQGALWLNYNLLKPWPIPKNSVRFIAAGHFIEHIDLNAGIDFFQRCYAVMQEGGVIRMSCPDLGTYIKHYVEKDEAFYQSDYVQGACTFKNARTPGQILAAKAYDSGGAHKWFYDAESLIDIMTRAGFTHVRQTTRLDSQVPDIEQIELAGREVETLYVEGQK